MDLLASLMSILEHLVDGIEIVLGFDGFERVLGLVKPEAILHS